MRTRTRTSNDSFPTTIVPRVGWGLRSTVLTVLVAFTVLIPSAAWAGAIVQPDFSDPTVTTFDGLRLTFFNPSPLAVDGHTVATDNGMFRYLPLGSADCLANECIGTHNDLGYLDIHLGQPMRRAGVWVGSSAATVYFFDETDAQLGSVDVTPVAGQTMDFAGWEATSGLIGRIRVTDTESNTKVVTVDNLMVEDSSAEPVPDVVTIDIRPGSANNQINLSSRVVPVAVLTTESFDASVVDPSTVTLADGPVRVKGNGEPSATLADVDGDGDRDLLLHIEAREMTLSTGDVEATLHGLTLSGELIEGTDIVRIVP